MVAIVLIAAVAGVAALIYKDVPQLKSLGSTPKPPPQTRDRDAKPDQHASRCHHHAALKPEHKSKNSGAGVSHPAPGTASDRKNAGNGRIGAVPAKQQFNKALATRRQANEFHPYRRSLLRSFFCVPVVEQRAAMYRGIRRQELSGREKLHGGWGLRRICRV